jgi:hypothetical protein
MNEVTTINRNNADNNNKNIKQMDGSAPKTSPESQESTTINNTIAGNITIQKGSCKWEEMHCNDTD